MIFILFEELNWKVEGVKSKNERLSPLCCLRKSITNLCINEQEEIKI